MTPGDFRAWRKSLKLTQAGAATALGVSKSSIELYEAGRRRDNGALVEIPYLVALACAAVHRGLAPWPPSETDPPKGAL